MNDYERYVGAEELHPHGTPGMSYCASELFLSSNYFGDLVKTATGDTVSHYIRLRNSLRQ